MSWKQYAPDDPEGLRPFVEDYMNRLIKSGAFIILDDEEGERREQQVWDEMMKEQKDHIENWPTSRCPTPTAVTPNDYTTYHKA